MRWLRNLQTSTLQNSGNIFWLILLKFNSNEANDKIDEGNFVFSSKSFRLIWRPAIIANWRYPKSLLPLLNRLSNQSPILLSAEIDICRVKITSYGGRLSLFYLSLSTGE